MQRNCDLSKADGSDFDESDKKVRNFVMCYVDDVVIETSALADHIDRVGEVFNCMKRAGSKCKPSK